MNSNWIVCTLFAGLLAACGGGGGGGASAPAVPAARAPATAAVPAITFAATKIFHFSWTDVSDATHYRLLENPDGNSGFSQVGSDIPTGIQSIDHVVPLYARVNAQYILQSCNATGCTDSAGLPISDTLEESIGYVKASNTGPEDQFGYSVSLSSDGNVLAIGAPFEDGFAETDDAAPNSGAVFVFQRADTVWEQVDYVTPPVNIGVGDQFGYAVSLNSDGRILAVGAPFEDSNVMGTDTIPGFGNPNDLSADSGAVYLFNNDATRDLWRQKAYIKASNTGPDDRFGAAISLSHDGRTLAVGAPREDSNATGVNTGQGDNSEGASGAVYVFTGGSNLEMWTQRAYVKASNTDAGDEFGTALALSGDGFTLVVGAPFEDSDARVVDDVTNVGQDSNLVSSSGAAYVFTADAVTGEWGQEAYIKASNSGVGDQFGIAASLSENGNVLAVGAHLEDSSAFGVNLDEADNGSPDAGAVYVFTRSTINLGSGDWSKQAYLKASNTGAGDGFGNALSLSGDGNTLVVGANLEDGGGGAINGSQTFDPGLDAGAVYSFRRDAGAWSQQTYIKASNTRQDNFGDNLGIAISLSADGNTLAVGAHFEDGAATGINGDQFDDSQPNAGAVYLY